MSTKTKTHKTMKLPKDLPPLPPIPYGFDAWEYVGLGKSGSNHLMYKVVSFIGPDSIGWANVMNCYSGNEQDSHYIVAVKHPAPSKKQPKAKAVKARIWHRDVTRPIASGEKVRLGPNTLRCAVLDLYDQRGLIEQATQGILMELGDYIGSATAEIAARAVLESLGIIPKRKAK